MDSVCNNLDVQQCLTKGRAGVSIEFINETIISYTVLHALIFAPTTKLLLTIDVGDPIIEGSIFAYGCRGKVEA